MKPVGHTPRHRRIGDLERLRETSRELLHGRAQTERGGDGPDERFVGRVESGIEALGGDRDAFLSAETEETFFPGDAVRVERAAEVEEERQDGGVANCEL